MPDTPTILLRVEPASSDDPDDLDDLATQLRPHATIVAPGDAPPQKFDATTLIAALGSAGVITAVVKIVQVYLQRNPGRKATIEFKGHRLQLDGYNGAEIERAARVEQRMEAWGTRLFERVFPKRRIDPDPSSIGAGSAALAPKSSRA